MRNFDGDNLALVLLICVPLALFGGVIAMGFWDNNQVRVMYQQVYQKNMECRVAYKDRGDRYIDNVCGKLPVFEDFQNK